MITNFHFIRPWWLLAFIPAVLLWWLLRRRSEGTEAWRGIVAPHLLPFLLTGQEKHSRFGPLELLGLAWFFGVLAIAGPTWRREPSPFADDTAALAIVVKVTPSMKTEDLQPSRLARAAQKIQDLLAQRPGAKTSLIAYAGTAHVVMPITTDGGIIDTFAGALDPKIMPQDGDVAPEALRLADQTLAGAGGGSILWITDNIASDQISPLATWRKSSSTQVRLLPPLYAGQELEALNQAARTVQANVVGLTADDGDVRSLARAAKFSTSTAGGLSDRWKESGYWLTPLVAALALPFFRRGYMISTRVNR